MLIMPSGGEPDSSTQDSCDMKLADAPRRKTGRRCGLKARRATSGRSQTSFAGAIARSLRVAVNVSRHSNPRQNDRGCSRRRCHPRLSCAQRARVSRRAVRQEEDTRSRHSSRIRNLRGRSAGRHCGSRSGPAMPRHAGGGRRRIAVANRKIVSMSLPCGRSRSGGPGRAHVIPDHCRPSQMLGPEARPSRDQ